MTTLGIIGSGFIGKEVGRLAVAANLNVVIANSRGPETLTEVVADLGPLASAGTVDDVVEAGDFVLLTIPLPAVKTLRAGLLHDKIVLDTSNYYPSRDGRIAELDSESVTTSELVIGWLGDVRLVKAFNNILAVHIPQLARPSGAADRTALPLASNDDAARRDAATLLDRLGFDTIDAGSLADSWRFEPKANAYTQLYAPSPTTPNEEVFGLPGVPGAPVSASRLTATLAGATRVKVADRTR